MGSNSAFKGLMLQYFVYDT